MRVIVCHRLYFFHFAQTVARDTKYQSFSMREEFIIKLLDSDFCFWRSLQHVREEITSWRAFYWSTRRESRIIVRSKSVDILYATVPLVERLPLPPLPPLCPLRQLLLLLSRYISAVFTTLWVAGVAAECTNEDLATVTLSPFIVSCHPKCADDGGCSYSYGCNFRLDWTSEARNERSAEGR